MRIFPKAKLWHAYALNLGPVAASVALSLIAEQVPAYYGPLAFLSLICFAVALPCVGAAIWIYLDIRQEGK